LINFHELSEVVMSEGCSHGLIIKKSLP
jgi:hypothetical protein